MSATENNITMIETMIYDHNGASDGGQNDLTILRNPVMNRGTIVNMVIMIAAILRI